MKICIITSSFPLNRGDGSATAGLFVRDFSLTLADLGHQVTVLTPDKVPGKKEEYPGISVCWFRWLGGRKRLSYLKPYNPFDVASMISLFRNGKVVLDRFVSTSHFDHVLAMWAVPAGWLARGIKRRQGISYTTWCLGSDIWTYGRNPFFRSLIRRVLQTSDLVYADGVKLAEDAARLAGRPCSFLPSCRRLDPSLKRPLALPESGFRFLFVGRYAPVKGVDILLEAMARYVRQGHRGHLYLLGGG